LEAEITPYIRKPNTSDSRKPWLFAKEDFRYDLEADRYWCPAGEALPFCFQTTEQGRTIKYYATAACACCAIRQQCTRSKKGRRITRWVDENLLDEMERRVRASPEKMKLRKHLTDPLGNLRRRAMFGDVGHQDLNVHLILTF
jgi:hypothetical protein